MNTDEILKEFEDWHSNIYGKGVIETKAELATLVRKTITTLLTSEAEKREEWYLGKEIHCFGELHVVVGLSQMVYDKDCEGEPEWKITDKVQEIAIAKKIDGISFQKPCWLKPETLTNSTTPEADQADYKE